MTPKQKAVLSELDWLDRYSPPVFGIPSGRYWRPFHVRYWRNNNYPREEQMTMIACTHHLKAVHAAGWADKGKSDGFVGYRINDAGRKALEES